MHFISSAVLGLVVEWLAVAALFSGDAPARPSRGAPAIEFAGYHAMEKSAWVILADREKTEVSSWMKVGQEWKGIRLTRIDEKGESVFLTKGTESWVVQVRKGRGEEEAMAATRCPSGFTLLRGDVTGTEDTWVYSADAVVQFGQAVLSALTGVMIVEGDTIRGHLPLGSVDGHSIEADEATVRVIDGQSVLVAGRLGIKFSKK